MREEQLFSVIALPDGGVLGGGESQDVRQEVVDYSNNGPLLTRVDASGTVLWSRTEPNAGEWMVTGLALLPSGTPVAVGTRTVEGKARFWAAALKDDGSFLWEKTWSHTENDGLDAVSTDADGILVAGTLGSSDRPLLVARLSDKGEILWETRIKADVPLGARGAVADGKGGVVVVGFAETPDRSLDGLVVHVDKKGRESWRQVLGGAGMDNLASVAPAGDGWVVVGSTVRSKGDDAWIVRLDPSGKTVWDQALGGNNADVAVAVGSLPSGDLVVAGTSASFNREVSRGPFVMGLSSDGKQKWLYTPSFVVQSTAYDLAALPGGRWVVAGMENNATSRMDGCLFVVEPPAGP